MDLFLTLRNIDADGNEVLETGQQGTPVPVAKGWLRVSHRELDPDLSLPYRPYHKHTAPALSRRPARSCEVEVEIWPTSMVFRKGHRIRLDIQPRDGVGSAVLHALSRRLQHRHQHDLCWRRQGVLSAAAGHSAIAHARDDAATASNALRRHRWHLLTRKDVLAGLMFIGRCGVRPVALARLSDRHRVAHGHRLRAAAAVLDPARARRRRPGARAARGASRAAVGARRRRAGAPVVFVTASLVVFGLAHRAARPGRLDPAADGVGASRRAACGRSRRWSPALVLIALSWAIFILGLGLTIPVWPEW